MAAQHHFHNVHRFLVGYPHALHEYTFFAHFLQHLVNLRAAAVHNHRIDAHQFQEGNVFGKAFFQVFLGHGVAAVFDDESTAGKTADIRQRLAQNMGFHAGGDVFLFNAHGRLRINEIRFRLNTAIRIMPNKMPV